MAQLCETAPAGRTSTDAAPSGRRISLPAGRKAPARKASPPARRTPSTSSLASVARPGGGSRRPGHPRHGRRQQQTAAGAEAGAGGQVQSLAKQAAGRPEQVAGGIQQRSLEHRSRRQLQWLAEHRLDRQPVPAARVMALIGSSKLSVLPAGKKLSSSSRTPAVGTTRSPPR
ncbi:hypothetical protein P4123_29335 [Pseudomonas aeruginosa]|nr:hypothetical protein [Pseudomonas aeruginosa]